MKYQPALKLSLFTTAIAIIPKINTTFALLVGSALESHKLAALNPGNATGVLCSYALCCTLLSLIVRVVRIENSLTLKNVLWWVKIVTLLVTSFIAVKAVGTSFVDKQFGFLIAVTLTSLLIVQVTRTKFPEYDFSLHVSGVQVKSEKEITAARGPLLFGFLPWGADYIDQQEERLHFLLFGNIGGGKTTYMKMMMAAVAQRPGELWVVFDPKIELIPYLVALGKKPVILNPIDTRSCAWDLCKDVVNSVLAEGLAELLIGEAGSGGGGDGGQRTEDDHWTLSARNILVALIEVFIASGKPWDFRDICLAVSNTEDLTNLLSRNSNASILVQGLSGTHNSGANDYMLTVNTKLRPLHVVASRWHKSPDKMSIKELVSCSDFEDRAIVLGADHTAGTLIASLNALIFERFYQIVMNGPETHNTRYRVWVDELSSVTRRTGKSLERFMTEARSKGGSASLTAQNEAGMKNRLGKEVARGIFDTAIHKAVIGGVDSLTAKNISDEVGEQDLVEADIGYSLSNTTVDSEIDKGRSQKSDAKNTHQNFKRVRRPAVPKERLTDTAMPSASPKKGLHGFFMGSKAGGPHFAKFNWETVVNMQVEQDPDTESFSKLSDTSSDYQLTPWSRAEREKWNLSALGSPLSVAAEDENDSNSDRGSSTATTPFLPNWGTGKTEGDIARITLLEATGLKDADLSQILAAAGLSSTLKVFTMQQINTLDLHVNTVTLTVE